MVYLFVCMCVCGHLYAMTHVEVRGTVTVSIPFIIWFLTTQVVNLDSKCLCLRNQLPSPELQFSMCLPVNSTICLF